MILGSYVITNNIYFTHCTPMIYMGSFSVEKTIYHIVRTSIVYSKRLLVGPNGRLERLWVCSERRLGVSQCLLGGAWGYGGTCTGTGARDRAYEDATGLVCGSTAQHGHGLTSRLQKEKTGWRTRLRRYVSGKRVELVFNQQKLHESSSSRDGDTITPMMCRFFQVDFSRFLEGATWTASPACSEAWLSLHSTGDLIRNRVTKRQPDIYSSIRNPGAVVLKLVQNAPSTK